MQPNLIIEYEAETPASPTIISVMYNVVVLVGSGDILFRSVEQ